MIKIAFRAEPHGKKTQTNILTVTGHADMAAPGYDIYCASASILTYTLAQAIKNMHNDGIMLTRPVVSIAKTGRARIAWTPKPEYMHISGMALMTVMTGFELLARNYPDIFAVYRVTTTREE